VSRGLLGLLALLAGLSIPAAVAGCGASRSAEGVATEAAATGHRGAVPSGELGGEGRVPGVERLGRPGERRPGRTAPLGPEPRRWVDSTVAALDLRGAAAQLVVPWITGSYVAPSDPALDPVEVWADAGVGGFYLSIGGPLAFAARGNVLQARTELPLLFVSDFESGGPGMRLGGQYALPSLLRQGGGTEMPPTMAFGAIGEARWAREYGRITATEALAVGVPLNFAPVLDVNSNADNPVIATRSFGADPELVARLGVAYVEGAREAGGMTTAKHFPGHGDTDVDSHLGLPVIDRSRSELEAVELLPFRRAIAAGVDAVMTAHVSLPRLTDARVSVEGVDEDRRARADVAPPAPPATLTPEILTGLLREDLGFDGLVVTDALSMAAVSDRWGGGEAGVRALEAGADLLLMPADPVEVIDAVVEAVRSGRLTEARVRASTRRILETKAKAGLHAGRGVELEAVTERVGTGEHLAFADSAASRSITLVRDRARSVPLPALPGYAETVLSVTFARESDRIAGRAFDRTLRERFERVLPVRLGPDDGAGAWAATTAGADDADAVVVGVYLPAAAGTGLESLPSAARAFVRRSSAHRPTVVVSFGSPYLLDAFPQAPAYMLAWGGREVSQRAAAHALLGEQAITGTLPIEVPPYAIGHGLRRAVGEVADFDPRGATGANEPAPEDSAGPVAGRWTSQLLPMTVSPLEVDAADVAMDETHLEAIDSLILAALPDSAAPGAALAIGRRGRLVRLRGYGTLDWPGGAPGLGDEAVTPTTIFDLASVTKVVGTTSAIMMLEEDGLISLDDRVIEHLPWWSGGDPAKERVTLRQLLLHRAGLPPFRRWFFELAGEEAYREAIAAEPLETEPGAGTVYSDIGVMTLGILVEEVSGLRLDRFLERRLFEPLGMRDTGFLPDPALLERVAPTEVDTLWRGMHVHGIVHDENADAIGGVAGHAGLFSTARDLAVFADMMLSGGAVPPCAPAYRSGVPCSEPRADSVRVLRPGTIERYTDRFDATSSRALGWDTPSGRSSAGDYLSAGSFGHTGYTGTSIWMDPELDLFVILLTNRVNPTRANTRHVPLRREVADLAAQAITDREVAPRERGRR